MNAAAAISELARRQLELERRITALEQVSIEVDALPPFPGAGMPSSEVPEEPTLASGSTPAPGKGGVVFHENGIIDIPPPSENQRTLRARLLPSIGFEHWTRIAPEQGGEGAIPLPPAEAEEAYVKLGPVWLYNYDRSYLLSLSPAVRTAMVQDVQATDQEYAQQMGADLLKAEGEDSANPELAIDQDNAYRAAHGGTTGASA